MKFTETSLERGGRQAPDTGAGIAALSALTIWLATEAEAYFDLWQE